MIKVEAQVSTEQLLKAVEQMSPEELEIFAAQVLTLRAQLHAPSLPSSESELLLKINQGIPPHLQSRFNELVAKRQALTLTDTEQVELVQLTDQIEQLDVERVQYLGELARLREKSLGEIMDDLGIQTPACA